jgi:hypothetical protein
MKGIANMSVNVYWPLLMNDSRGCIERVHQMAQETSKYKPFQAIVTED